MSQAGIISTSSGPVPPTVATQYTADDASIAIPAANNLNTFTLASTTTDNVHGIESHNSGSTVGYRLTNRILGSVSTVGAASQTLISFPMGVSAGTYIFETKIVAYNSTGSLSAGYNLIEVIRTTGAAGVDIAPPDQYIVEEGSPGGMAQVSVTSGVSGNNYLITVTGYAGQTIDWKSLTTYTFTS